MVELYMLMEHQQLQQFAILFSQKIRVQVLVEQLQRMPEQLIFQIQISRRTEQRMAVQFTRPEMVQSSL